MTGPLVTINTYIAILHASLKTSFKDMMCSFYKFNHTYIAIWQYIVIHSKAIRNMAMTHVVASLTASHEYSHLFTIFSLKAH